MILLVSKSLRSLNRQTYSLCSPLVRPIYGRSACVFCNKIGNCFVFVHIPTINIRAAEKQYRGFVFVTHIGFSPIREFIFANRFNLAVFYRHQRLVFVFCFFVVIVHETLCILFDIKIAKYFEHAEKYQKY